MMPFSPQLIDLAYPTVGLVDHRSGRGSFAAPVRWSRGVAPQPVLTLPSPQQYSLLFLISPQRDGSVLPIPLWVRVQGAVGFAPGPGGTPMGIFEGLAMTFVDLGDAVISNTPLIYASVRPNTVLTFGTQHQASLWDDEGPVVAGMVPAPSFFPLQPAPDTHV